MTDQPIPGLKFDPKAAPLTLAANHTVVIPNDVNLVGKASDLLARAVRRIAPSEEIGHSVSMTVVPGQAPGTFLPVLVLVLTGRAVSLGERCVVTVVTQDLHLTREGVEEVVHGALEQMREQRSLATAQALGDSTV